MKTQRRKYAAEQGIAEEEVEDSSRCEASEKAFAERKAEGRVCGRRRAHFVEKGAEVCAKV